MVLQSHKSGCVCVEALFCQMWSHILIIHFLKLLLHVQMTVTPCITYIINSTTISVVNLPGLDILTLPPPPAHMA